MSYSFVIARLDPQLSARWTSYYGIQKAAALVTRPFLALRVRATDVGYGDHFKPERHHLLFIVSPDKPTGMSRDCYATLVPPAIEEKRCLVVDPPLPSGGRTLYIHTFPKLAEKVNYSHKKPANQVPISPHRFDEPSFQTFCRFVREDHAHRMQLQRLDSIERSSYGDAHLVQDDWDTWSGQSPTEYLHDPDDFKFDLLPVENTLSASSSIYLELLLFKQFTVDYSWPGVTPTISWAQKLHDYAVKPSPPQIQFVNVGSMCRGDLPELRSGLQDSINALCSMKVPFDGDPPVVMDDSNQCEWDDGPDPDFERVPSSNPPQPAVDVKIVAFDLFGTIFDRETAVREALQLVTRSDVDNHPPRQLELYIELESLRHKEQPQAAYVDIARSALKDFGTCLGAFVNDMKLEEALECLLRPRLHADALPAIKALRARGCTVIGFSSLDTDTFARYIQSTVPTDITMVFPSTKTAPLFSQNRLIFPRFLEYSRSIDDAIKPSQILVVTASPYRIVEPASSAGFPTALIQRTESLESKVEIYTAVPTMITDGLSRVCTELEGSSKITVDPISPPSQSIDPFRIFGLYHVTKPLGYGSFGQVFGGFHLLTGEEVAIKFEMPTGKANEICVLPYEAQIYRHLHGYQGIPKLRSFGMDGGAHVLVLDKLGPNLQHLRRFCRGQLSLKTVLMIGEQMLSRIEFAHSKGVILRDIKPENFAMGIGDRSNTVHLFDLGLAKLVVIPLTNEHIPFRNGRIGLGTPRYASYNVHFGREQSRRDDLEALGNVLLFLLHGRLPWQGIFAPNVEAKLIRIGEMKAGSVFQDFLRRSPPEFTKYFDHCRSLAFQEKPNYLLLRQIFQQRMEWEGWTHDGAFDWVKGVSEKGTIAPGEYKWDERFVDVDFHR